MISTAGPVVVTHELTKRYGEFTALDNLSFMLDRGQILGFIGPNGAGKTTTIKILVGLMRPTSGSASIAGADCVRDARRIKRLVGFMPDTFGSYDNMRVREYLDFFGAAFGIGRRERTRRIDEVLETTGSTYMRDRYVESLSHGMKQRIGVARTLLHDPDVLILDEPANGLDPQARIEMRELLLRLSDMGKTLIVTSHILPELSRICNIVAIMTKGKLRAFGTLDQIMQAIRQRRTFEVQLVEGTKAAEVAEAVTKGLDLGGLVRASLGVAQFREVPTDLEDAFLTVTRES
ncbi:ABC transporter ATP-binding protein [bacterium]|nr:ABC transporter ATP-binding protein [bacterium]